MNPAGAALRVIVTRPLDQALDWAAKLQGHGIDAVALPLIEIGAIAQPAPVRDAWLRLGGIDALMFVSPNAVQHFFAQRPPQARWPEALCAASPGPGTSAALRSAGVPHAAIVEPPPVEGRFDSEALWAVLQPARDWRGAAVLVLRGTNDDTPQGSGRDWLAQQWLAAGARVETLAVYRRGAPVFSAEHRAAWQRARLSPAQHLWLFSSSEAVDHAVELARAETGASQSRTAGARPVADAAQGSAVAHAAQQDEAAYIHGATEGAAPALDWSDAQALATHPRIAERARAAGFGRVIEAAPTLAAIVAAIARIEPAGHGRSINSDEP